MIHCSGEKVEYVVGVKTNSAEVDARYLPAGDVAESVKRVI